MTQGYSYAANAGSKDHIRKSREIIKTLEKDGWYLVATRGSHHQYKHPTKSGRVTIKHPDKDIPIDTLKSIARQSGLNFD